MKTDLRTVITHSYRFAASHRLHSDTLSIEENEVLYGKCNNPYGHGHNYRLDVTVAGPVHALTGQLLPPEHLDRLVREQILNRFDHRNINQDVREFADLIPTTENLLAVITEILQQHWSWYISGPATLDRVHVQETDRNGFETLLENRYRSSLKSRTQRSAPVGA